MLLKKYVKFYVFSQCYCKFVKKKRKFIAHQFSNKLNFMSSFTHIYLVLNFTL